MGCVLRVSGVDLDASDLAKLINLTPVRIWRKGEPRRSGVFSGSSGAVFNVAGEEVNDLGTAISLARDFLVRHRDDLVALRTLRGIDEVALDFSIMLRNDTVTHSDYLPSVFLIAAAECGVDIELTHYPASD